MLQSSQMEVTLFFVVSISLFDELREGLKIETTLFFFSFVLDFVVSVTETNRGGPLVEYERRIASGELVEGDSCQVECLHFHLILIHNWIDEMDLPTSVCW